MGVRKQARAGKSKGWKMKARDFTAMLNRVKAAGVRKTKARVVKRVKELQKVAVRKIGRQLPATAVSTVMEMMLGKR